jgi:DNA-binding transcriptional ArsR family regulator
MSQAAQVRQALAELGEASVREVADALGVTQYAQVGQVRKVMDDLKKRGLVVSRRESPGATTRYRLNRERPETLTKQRKLWAAMQVKQDQSGGFLARDVARLAEACRDYTNRLLRFYARQGCVVPPEKPGGMYQVAPEWRSQQKRPPHWHRQQEERGRRESRKTPPSPQPSPARGEGEREKAAPPAAPPPAPGERLRYLIAKIRGDLKDLVSLAAQVNFQANESLAEIDNLMASLAREACDESRGADQ